ncbi:hypothetical protein BC827DRAFT_1159471 [Russula dissimulans]|nr:hypothetical protein BC827DRAFT_1159471 [Russula dissimulans]
MSTPSFVLTITSTTLCHRSQQLSATQVIQDMGPYAGDNLSTQLAANLGFAAWSTLGRDLLQLCTISLWHMGTKPVVVFLASPYLMTMETPNLGGKSYANTRASDTAMTRVAVGKRGIGARFFTGDKWGRVDAEVSERSLFDKGLWQTW